MKAAALFLAFVAAGTGDQIGLFEKRREAIRAKKQAVASRDVRLSQQRGFNLPTKNGNVNSLLKNVDQSFGRLSTFFTGGTGSKTTKQAPYKPHSQGDNFGAAEGAVVEMHSAEEDQGHDGQDVGAAPSAAPTYLGEHTFGEEHARIDQDSGIPGLMITSWSPVAFKSLGPKALNVAIVQIRNTSSAPMALYPTIVIIHGGGWVCGNGGAYHLKLQSKILEAVAEDGLEIIGGITIASVRALDMLYYCALFVSQVDYRLIHCTRTTIHHTYTIQIDYRLTPEANKYGQYPVRFPAQLEDVVDRYSV
jgi:hypothetical protein